MEEIRDVVEAAGAGLILEGDVANLEVAITDLPLLGGGIDRIKAIADITALGNVGDGIGLAGVISEGELEHGRWLAALKLSQNHLLLKDVLPLHQFLHIVRSQPKRGGVYVIAEQKFVGGE